MHFLGALTKRDKCTIAEPNMTFIEDKEHQMVISESAVSCALNTLANSEIGDIQLNYATVA